ncbi:alpha/beta hydrolase [Clostridium swellfunianum]|uniref:alpha/beta hydrolase n=1 Tax=Clostridium swellfunianum TaxID=1367462 RepID=UPI002030B216|nr:alpha/beta hydrolase [Clostridium swellfunianum]MCM0649344.1 alpha/beta hydrolase [Clostridium swellfunianum]
MINKTIELWENLTFQRSELDDFKPTLVSYVLGGNKKRAAVLVCPGGGYRITSDREAEQIAIQFNAAGFHAFVVYYSCAPRKHPQPLMDVSRAMCIIRENAEEWNVDVDKIAVCGFSAGGHLAASLGVHWEKSYLLENPGIKQGLNKPNALILSYPVISSGELAHRDSFVNLLGVEADSNLLYEMSLEHHVKMSTSPTFIWHTVEDKTVPVENTILFAQALCKNKVPFELHIYPKGPHGLSLATAETQTKEKEINLHVATWMNLCIQWLDELF